MKARIRELDLYYEAVGHGPPVLMLSGAANVVDWFRPVVRRLQERHTCVSFDYPGCGRSERASAVSMSFLADCGVALMEDLGHDRFSVVGLSMGGIVTQEMLLRAGSRIERAVLFTSGPARIPEEQAIRLREILRSGEDGLSPSDRVRSSGPTIFTQAFVGSPGYEEWLSWQAPLAAPADVLNEYLSAGLAHDVLDDLPAIDVPVLVVSATGDRFVPLSVGDQLARGIPNAQHLILHGGSHGLIYECPEYSSTVIADFLRSDLNELLQPGLTAV